VSLSRETLLDLMGFADGELEGEARDRAEKLVASSEEARRVVEAMRDGTLGAWLGEVTQDRAIAAGADGIAEAVMAKVAAVHPGVVRVAPSPLPPPVPIGDLSARRAFRGWGAVRGGLALAIAAGVAALYVRMQPTRPEGHSPVAQVGPSAALPEAPSLTPTALAQGGPAVHGVEVDEIDSPSHGISVFEIPMGAAAAAASPGHAASVVIWIEDEPGVQ
jgi:hypothetical protein